MTPRATGERKAGALKGALCPGALAGVGGQVLAARYASLAERRRLAIEAGYREWEHMRDVLRMRGRRLLPPIVFIHYSHELMKLLERGTLSAEGYRDVIRRSDSLRAVSEEEQARRSEGER